MTVRAEVAEVVVLSMLTEVGESEQVISTLVFVGAQVKETEPLYPPLPETVTVDVPDCPGEEIVIAVEVTAKLGATPEFGQAVSN